MIKDFLGMILWGLGATLILLFWIGILQWDKPEYACFSGRGFAFEEPVKILHVGSFRVNAIPLTHDCSEDDRYDPKLIYECDYQTYCQRSDLDE